jgi:Arc/MetJ-type ribon-helix-helix transcriptional regulator
VLLPVEVFEKLMVLGQKRKVSRSELVRESILLLLKKHKRK